MLEHGKYPYVVRMSYNNGQKGYINENEKYLNAGNTISFGQDTATMFYQEKPYFTGDKIKILKSRHKRFGKSNAQFFIAALTKSFSLFSWGNSSFSVDIIKKQIVTLPKKNNEPDFDFIDSFMEELEKEHIKHLKAFLYGAGLKDCNLTNEEQKALDVYTKINWEEYRIGDIFQKVDLGLKNKYFNKKTDLSTCYDKEHTIPVTNAKFGDNGIMFWAKKNDFETASMSIDIVQNGAIATGKVYPQPQETGVLWDSYLIKLKDYFPSKEVLFFLTTAIEKSIQNKYCYEYKAYWNKVQNDSILLPTKDSSPDFEYMRFFISAIQKIVIKNVISIC